MKSIENFLEKFIFQGRWLLAPFYVGLILAIGLLLVMFIKEFVHFAPAVFNGDTSDAVIGILGLIDVVMIANLVLIIVFAGYENFVSRIDTKDSEDRPDWMGTVSFSDLKIKLIGSIVAISGVELLKVFMSVSAYTTEELAWKVGLHLTFVFSGVLYALMDKLSHASSRHS
jgi:uncharacterized protein (TIGR00645 family)